MFQFKNLENYREQRLISRAEMARKTGLSPLTINKLEGGRACRPDTAKKILESLDIFLTGGGFSYDEKRSDSVVYSSPALRPNSSQLMLIKVAEDDEPAVRPGRGHGKIGRPPVAAPTAKSHPAAKGGAGKGKGKAEPKAKPKAKR
ncbi:MAG: helix-turn-helix transcriptional regulator [Deltaproteobacteria bacterium]|jgi:transcriptional regulator with XRE-family HTH domain|nr:helix-turn-helix transcriptional regulator [Deltaproteobacteria bacterium]